MYLFYSLVFRSNSRSNSPSSTKKSTMVEKTGQNHSSNAFSKEIHEKIITRPGSMALQEEIEKDPEAKEKIFGVVFEDYFDHMCHKYATYTIQKLQSRLTTADFISLLNLLARKDVAYIFHNNIGSFIIRDFFDSASKHYLNLQNESLKGEMQSAMNNALSLVYKSMGVIACHVSGNVVIKNLLRLLPKEFRDKLVEAIIHSLEILLPDHFGCMVVEKLVETDSHVILNHLVRGIKENKLESDNPFARWLHPGSVQVMFHKLLDNCTKDQLRLFDEFALSHARLFHRLPAGSEFLNLLEQKVNNSIDIRSNENRSSDSRHFSDRRDQDGRNDRRSNR